LLLIILVEVLSIWYSPYDPNLQNVPHANLPPRIPHVNINGFNGKAKISGVWVDKYELVHVPKD
ncbi:MAG TPA: ABC transporter permease, partial [Clostridiaceae bacterium]|nr:ABC transporter permease [Clostridiaceae bacterium]